MDYVIYTFHSSSQAMQSEMLMESNNIKCRLVPLLPEIDAGCGLALRFSIDYYKEVEKIFLDNNFNYQDRYLLSYPQDSRKPVVKKYDLS